MIGFICLCLYLWYRSHVFMQRHGYLIQDFKWFDENTWKPGKQDVYCERNFYYHLAKELLGCLCFVLGCTLGYVIVGFFS